jgi:hypothetical protein
LVIDRVRSKALTKAFVKILLLLVTKDAAGEAREVVAGSREEAGYTWDVHDICTNVERKWKGKRFHGDNSRVEGCAGTVAGRSVGKMLRKTVNTGRDKLATSTHTMFPQEGSWMSRNG